MADDFNDNSDSKWISWRKYVEAMAMDVREIREKLVELRIDLAVTKTKQGIYITIICFIVTVLINLGFAWLKGKI